MANNTNSDIDVLAEHREARPLGGSITVAVAQLGGPWLDPKARLARALHAAETAARRGAELIVYPETYLSGYPFWLSRTGGAAFDDPEQKACYAYYLDAGIEIGGAEQRELETASADLGISMIMGIAERGRSLGRTSIWCTLLTIDPAAGLVGHHRKLVPTYDERLVWAPGDGAGLRTHRVAAATVGSLNCWENWMPQARSALHALGEDVHVGVWPGSATLTGDITRFVAAEGRAFSVAASGIATAEDIPDGFPLAERLRESAADLPFDGGSCIAGPDGKWILPPVTNAEGLLIAELALARVSEERLNFDPTGHYARPDVFRTTVRRSRNDTVAFIDTPPRDETETADD
ncbi:carbon-nitrogen hydrolase family protein [Saccharopolyspora shandongensis]|uniref:carbon-nitrogen hydrolase family protein n=1 Tax=Saccharopolyspora shandongensis TaxID=418495 RepID=UPI003409BFFD